VKKIIHIVIILSAIAFVPFISLSAETNIIFQDMFDGTQIDSNKWNVNQIWNRNNNDLTKYFANPIISGGNLFFQDNGTLSLLANNNQAYLGLRSASKYLKGDFDLITFVNNFQIQTVSPSIEGWWGSFYIRLETGTEWNQSKIIHIRISKGNEHNGNYDGYGLFYYINGIKQNIGCSYENGTNCWVNSSQITGDKSKVRVKRNGDTVNIYFGDTLFHSFSEVTTEDLYITWNLGVWNETSGTFKSYSVQVPEVTVFDASNSDLSAPGIDIGTGGVFHVSDSSGSNTEVHLFIWDHKGISSDGSSHTVVMTLPTGSQKILNFDKKYSDVQAMYRLWISGSPPSNGDYIFTVSDKDGQSATIIDTQLTKVIPSVDEASVVVVPNGTSPTIRWTPLQGFLGYQLFVYSDESKIFWSSGIGAESEMTIPPGILNPSTSYKFRICAFLEDASINLQNVSYSNYIDFNTGSPYQHPFIAFGEAQISPVVYLSNYGGYMLFKASVFDVQGVPDNIEKVEVVFPDGMTRERLHYQSPDSFGGGLYQTSSLPGTPSNGSYTFHAWDKNGNHFARSKAFTYDPLIEPNWKESTPADGTVITRNTVDIDWPDVSGANAYSLGIYDKKGQIYFSKWLYNSQCSFPRGILKENETYYFVARAYREGSIQQNYIVMWNNASNKFVLSPKYGGASKPVFDSTLINLATSHIADRPSYYLEIQANITDQDGLQNIQKIVVTGPKGNVYPLNTISPTDAIKAKYSCVIPVDSVPSSGTYVFTATDFDGNIVTTTRQHSALPLTYMSVDSVSLGHNNEATIPVSLYWTPIAGAASYQVELFNAYGNSKLKTYGNISSPYFSIPDNVLEKGKSYRYRVSAYDQYFNNCSKPQLYFNLCPIFHLTSEPKACTATLDGNLLLHTNLSYVDPISGAISLWADFIYEFNPTYSSLLLFKLSSYGIINDPSFSCAASTLSSDFKIYIPDVLLPYGTTHLWLDLEYSPAVSNDKNAYFVVTNAGVSN